MCADRVGRGEEAVAQRGRVGGRGAAAAAAAAQAAASRAAAVRTAPWPFSYFHICHPLTRKHPIHPNIYIL